MYSFNFLFWFRYGTWGTPEMAPIKLQRCPAAMGAIYPVLAPLAVGDIVKLVVADDVFPPEFRDLGVGGKYKKINLQYPRETASRKFRRTLRLFFFQFCVVFYV